MIPMAEARSSRVRRRRMRRALLATLVAVVAFVGFTQAGGGDHAGAAPSIAQTYYTPFEAQEFIDVLRSIHGDSACCSGPVHSTVSITSGSDGNTVVYDHFEDGYETDPLNPVQATTLTLALDAGDVWTQTSSVPVDQPGRGAGSFFDGRDRVSSTSPIAVTQTGYADTPGTVHAGGVQVLDVDKSGLQFNVPAGQDADYNSVFQYVGLVVVATTDDTTVQIDADSDGSFEASVTLDEGQTHIVDGGVMLGAQVVADKPVSAYVSTGDVGANYEGRFFELYPTSIWSDSVVSPVGSQAEGDETRVFLFNPGASAIDVDVETGAGTTSTISIGAGAQQSFMMPVDYGARFASQGGEPLYAFQAITTEGSSTAAFDWSFSLIPGQAATHAVIVPYGPGSEGTTHNYSPVWVAPDADTTLYVDRDGDPTTGDEVDANGDRYDFACVVGRFDSITIYDDGTTNCYLPSQSAVTTGGDRDMTGARIYALDGARLVAAWGQRPNYTTGSPALDMGTTVLPLPEIVLAKSSVLSDDVDGDGLADPGDEITYTVEMTNLGIVDVGSVLLTDETPNHTTFVAGSATFDGGPLADDESGFSPNPFDVDSPGGGLGVGTIAAGGTRTATFAVTVDDPVPIGVGAVTNLATMTTEVGPASASDSRALDVPPLQIAKVSSPEATPVGSGDTVAYTIQVFNADETAHTGVDVTDTLPTGVTYVTDSAAADVDGAPVAASGPPNLVTGAALEPGEVLTITFDVTVDVPIAAGTTGFTNTASVVSDQSPTPASDEAVDPAGPEADLSVAKADDVTGTVAPGDRITYTVTVTNSGPDEASAVQVTDTLPSGVTFVSAASDPACVEGPEGTITCSVGDLGLTTVDLDIAVDIDAGVDGTLQNEVTVSSSTTEASPGDETATVDTQADALPSLTVSKSAAPTTVQEPGGTVTFAVEVTNTSVEPVTLTTLVDDVFGDLLDDTNLAVSANNCSTEPAAITVSGVFSCSFDAQVSGGAGDPDHVDTVTATVTDDEGNAVSGADLAVVSFTDALPVVTLDLSAGVASVPEPGGPVTFTITVTNGSAEDVTLRSLVDDTFGDLLDAAHGSVSANTCEDLPSVFGAGFAAACTFDAAVEGDASGPDHVGTATVEVEDDEGNLATDDALATVAFEDVLPEVEVAKTAVPGTVEEPGGMVRFTIDLTNPGPEALTISGLTDDIFGDLLDAANPAIQANGCASAPSSIAPAAAVECSFDASVSGFFGDPAHVDTVTATVADDDGNTAAADDSASVSFTPAGSTLSGGVFVDSDHDGAPDEGEPGLAGVEVVVRDASDTEIVVITAEDGGWTASVVPGEATVDVDESTVAAGHVLTTANDPQTAAALAGTDVATDPVGYGPPNGEVSGVLFVDFDGNGVADDWESGIAEVSVRLRDEGGAVVASTETAADGAYRFDGLATGEFTVDVDDAMIPAGLEGAVEPDGTLDGECGVAVAAGSAAEGYDFGYRGTGAVGDVVWHDADSNGVLDIDEEAISGAAVTVLWRGFDGIAGTADDLELGPIHTGPDGRYLVANLPPGTYDIQIDVASVSGTAAPTTGTWYQISLEEGSHDMTADFGFAFDDLPLTGLAADRLLLAAALMALTGAIALLALRRRDRRFKVAITRLRR